MAEATSTVPRYLSPRQAGDAYPALGERYFRRLIADRRIPYAKVGAKVLLAVDDIEELIENGRVEPRVRRASRLRSTG